MKKITFTLATFFFISFSFNLTNATVINITNCSVLNQAGATYYLVSNITNSTATNCISITVNNITLDCLNHTIDGIDVYDRRGINVDGRRNITIKNCILTDWWHGIRLTKTQDSVITNNILYSNSVDIMLITDNLYNLITNNTVYRSSHGIHISRSNYNTIRNNMVSIHDNHGIHIHYSYGNTIENNRINNSRWFGVNLDNSNSNVVTKNTIENNIAGDSAGIRFLASNNNLITDNKLNNNFVGIRVEDSGGNRIYNNLFNSTYLNVVFYAPHLTNYWNTTRQFGERVYSNGTEIGGNYWTNITGNGYSDICDDEDKDGFCDNPYIFAGGIGIDYLPYSNKYVSPIPIYYTLTISTNNPECGIFVPSIGTYNLSKGQRITISVYPFCRFQNWQLGNGTNITTTSFDLTMDQDYNATCYFYEEKNGRRQPPDVGGGIALPERQAYLNPLFSGYFVTFLFNIIIAGFVVSQVRNILFGIGAFLLVFTVFLMFGLYPPIFYALLIFLVAIIITTIVITYIVGGRK